MSLIALALAPCVAAAPAAAELRMDAVARAAGLEYLAAEKGVGLSIGIVRNGRTFFYDFGSVSAHGAAPTHATAYEIGSISKTMTGLLLARAVTAGKARLDDDVRRHLDGAYPKLEYQGAPVTLLHLANMTSALPNELPDLSALDPDPGRFAHARALAAYGKAQFLRDLQGVAPSDKPGENVAHSNVAARLLIHALEHIYGEPYEALLAREIERPLGVPSGARPEATGHDGEGRVAAALPRTSFGYRYSACDMVRYAALELDESDPAVRLSHQGTWFTLDRTTSVGLTWISTTLPAGGRHIRYSGGTWGFASAMSLYPERKLGIVLLANKASDTAQDRLAGIATRIAEALAAD